MYQTSNNTKEEYTVHGGPMWKESGALRRGLTKFLI